MTDCPNCQAANPDGAKFCMNCGHSLALVCPNCGTELPATAKFCFNCGHKLEIGEQRPATDDRRPATDVQSPIPHLQSPQFMPAQLVAKLEAARGSRAMVGERRIVTIFLATLKARRRWPDSLTPKNGRKS
ncbi:MAG TPA: zinc ribbon domain-containing protein [Anaerolineae bacterium]